MKPGLWIGKLGLAIALGLVGMPEAALLQAQDDAKDKKTEPVIVEEPVDMPAPSKESDDESKDHNWRRGEPAVMVGNDFVLKEEEMAGDVAVVSGDATIDGHVKGNLVVVAGSAKVVGRVDGHMVVVLGSATLGPESRIGRDVCVVGGTLTRDPGAKIGGNSRVISTLGIFPNFEWLKTYAVHGLMLARPIAPQVGWVWAVVGISLLVYLLIAVLFPRPIQACVDTLEKRPIASFFMGLLLFVLFAPLTFLLAVSVVGIVVIPFLFCAMIVAFLFGKVSV
ncbi:MAG TPA: polymer-forming cytoskeletal protein, partial [Haliangiales bacterium]|nr:polymer-forming cytoskeletal protein [Haliangiales bacterium]